MLLNPGWQTKEIMCFNKVPHNTINAAKTAVAEVMSPMNKDTIIKACDAISSHLEAVATTKGGHIE